MELQELPSVAPASQPTVLACGAWLKNTACVLQGNRVYWSAVHGDLGDPDNCVALERSVSELIGRAGGTIHAVAHDLHPDFFSSRLAQQIAAANNVPAIAVQHHHAHIGVLMAEQALNMPVVGLALDGVGLGTDGVAWGGELLWVAPDSWRRYGHFQQLSLPGGDAAAREPWRMAASVLHGLGRGAEIEPRFAGVAGAAAARTLRTMLDKGIHCPPTTSAGRWFDAAAGALGICPKQSFEAEAAIALEKLAAEYLSQHGDPEPAIEGLLGDDGTLDLRPLLARLFALADAGDAGAHGAALFHVTLAAAMAQWAAREAQARGVATIALGGGCFLNKVMTGRLTAHLQQRGLRVLLPRTSCGDAGLALGQAWVARQQLAAAASDLKKEMTCV